MSEDVPSTEERRLIAAVARRFYFNDSSKVEIADELGLSRFKVARLLEQARASGIVTITLNDAGIPDEELSERLRLHLNLTECLVVDSYGDTDDVRRQIGGAAATLLTQTLHEGDVLGLASGRTISAMTGQLRNLPKLSVVQLTGAVGTDITESPVEIVRLASRQAGGLALPIYAPLVLDDAATVAALKRQPDIAEAITMFSEITVAVLAVGSWNPPNSRLVNYLPKADRAALDRQGVQAEVAAIFIDPNGHFVGQEYTSRYLSISAEGLSAIPRVIAVAGGADKADAVLAVARAGLLTGLVTDRALAEATLSQPPRPTPAVAEAPPDAAAPTATKRAPSNAARKIRTSTRNPRR